MKFEKPNKTHPHYKNHWEFLQGRSIGNFATSKPFELSVMEKLRNGERYEDLLVPERRLCWRYFGILSDGWYSKRTNVCFGKHLYESEKEFMKHTLLKYCIVERRNLRARLIKSTIENDLSAPTFVSKGIARQLKGKNPLYAKKVLRQHRSQEVLADRGKHINRRVSYFTAFLFRAPVEVPGNHFWYAEKLESTRALKVLLKKTSELARNSGVEGPSGIASKCNSVGEDD